MGIPSYFLSIVKKHPELLHKFIPDLFAPDISSADDSNNSNANYDFYAAPAVANLYMDCNSIIYDVIHEPSTFEGLISSADINNKRHYPVIINAVIRQIECYIEQINPSELVFLAFDGVAPLAKLKQQRERRYRTEYMQFIENKILADFDNSTQQFCHGTSASTPRAKWDTTVITPGTQFMDDLASTLHKHFLFKSQSPKSLPSNGANCGKMYPNVHLSLSDEAGEGEHKIFEHIRSSSRSNSNSSNSSNNSNNSTGASVVYGLDADLIMLALHHLKYDPQILLFRETPHFIQHVNQSLEPDYLYVLDINQLGHIVAGELTNSKISNASLPAPPIHPPNPDLINDYVFLCFFLGNDFMPHFPSLNIRTNGYDRLVAAYQSTIGKQNRHLISTDTGEIKWLSVKALITFLAQHETEYILKELEIRRAQFDRATANVKQFKNNQAAKQCTEENLVAMQQLMQEKTIDYINNLPILSRDVEISIKIPHPEWELQYYFLLLNVDLTTQSQSQSQSPSKTRSQSQSKDSCTIPDQKLEKICTLFLQSLEFTWKYYTKACPDWLWKPEYAYPPLLKDLQHFTPIFDTSLLHKNNNFNSNSNSNSNSKIKRKISCHSNNDDTNSNNKFSPLEQLCYVLPTHSSRNIIPTTLRNMIIYTGANKSWIEHKHLDADLYNSVEISMSFCRYLWEAHINLPSVNIEQMRKCIDLFVKSAIK